MAADDTAKTGPETMETKGCCWNSDSTGSVPRRYERAMAEYLAEYDHFYILLCRLGCVFPTADVQCPKGTD